MRKRDEKRRCNRICFARSAVLNVAEKDALTNYLRDATDFDPDERIEQRQIQMEASIRCLLRSIHLVIYHHHCCQSGSDQILGSLVLSS